jgi:hypothetical protein
VPRSGPCGRSRRPVPPECLGPTRLRWGFRGQWMSSAVSTRLLCSMDPEVQAIQLSPCRPGLGGPAPWRLQSIPPSPTCYFPLQFSPSGRSDDPGALHSTPLVLHEDQTTSRSDAQTPIRKPFLLKDAIVLPDTGSLGMRNGGGRFVRWLPPRPPIPRPPDQIEKKAQPRPGIPELQPGPPPQRLVNRSPIRGTFPLGSRGYASERTLNRFLEFPPHVVCSISGFGADSDTTFRDRVFTSQHLPVSRNSTEHPPSADLDFRNRVW